MYHCVIVLVNYCCADRCCYCLVLICLCCFLYYLFSAWQQQRQHTYTNFCIVNKAICLENFSCSRFGCSGLSKVMWLFNTKRSIWTMAKISLKRWSALRKWFILQAYMVVLLCQSCKSSPLVLVFLFSSYFFVLGYKLNTSFNIK